MRRISKVSRGLSLLLSFLLVSVSLGQDKIENPPSTEQDRQLWQAVRTENLAEVNRLLQSGAKVNARNEYGATALMFAADRGNEEIVNVLLQSGADPTISDSFYKSNPIEWADSKGFRAIVLAMLAKCGPDVVESHLQRAIQRNDLKFAQSILEQQILPTATLIRTRDQVLAKPEAVVADWLALFAPFGLPEPIKQADASDGLSSDSEKSATPPPIAAESDSESDLPPQFGPSSAESLQLDLAISSSNWPQFRGSGARGVAEGQHPPDQWQFDEDHTKAQNISWRVAVPGLGLSSPTVWEGRIFLTSAYSAAADNQLKTGLYGDVSSLEEDVDYEFLVFCFDKTSGDLLWKRTAMKAKPAVKRHAKSSHANSTIATNGEYLIAFFASEGLYCYNLEGELIWQKDLGLLDSGWFYDASYQWGFGSSPIIFEDTVIVQCDIQQTSYIAAFDLATGKERWRTERDEIPSWSTPTVHQFGDLAMLLTHATKAARGYDARTGELLWSLGRHSEIVVPTPFVAHDLIFIASGYSPIQPIIAIRPSARGAFDLDQLKGLPDSNDRESIQSDSDQRGLPDAAAEGLDVNDESSSPIAWSLLKHGPYMPTPIVYGDYLYCCGNSGILGCYQATTGQEVYRVRMRAPGGGLAFTASPLAADGKLYFTAEDGRVLVVAAGPEYELLFTNHCGDSVLATPAISEGSIYFRSHQYLIAVGE